VAIFYLIPIRKNMISPPNGLHIRRPRKFCRCVYHSILFLISRPLLLSPIDWVCQNLFLVLSTAGYFSWKLITNPPYSNPIETESSFFLFRQLLDLGHFSRCYSSVMEDNCVNHDLSFLSRPFSSVLKEFSPTFSP